MKGALRTEATTSGPSSHRWREHLMSPIRDSRTGGWHIPVRPSATPSRRVLPEKELLAVIAAIVIILAVLVVAGRGRGWPFGAGGAAVRAGHRVPVRQDPVAAARRGADDDQAGRRPDAEGQHADRRDGGPGSGGHHQRQRDRPGGRGGLLPGGGPDQGDRERAELPVRGLPAGADVAAVDHRPVRDGPAALGAGHRSTGSCAASSTSRPRARGASGSSGWRSRTSRCPRA